MKDLCQKCKSKPAVFYYEQTINGQKTEYALCTDCAAEWKRAHKLHEEPLFAVADMSPFSGLDALFGSLFAPNTAISYTSKKCPLCGASFAELKRSGKVGCATCYETFEEELAPTLRSIHGTQKHTGRAPASLKSETQRKKRLEALRAELNRAVEIQAYEEAAKLRDEIRKIENEG